MVKSILVIAAHPDDEVLGCGGTIACYTAQDIPVRVIFLADGISSREASDMAELESRHLAARKAAECLGISEVSFGEFPDNQLDTVPLLSIVKRIEQAIANYQPDTIFTHHIGDVNIDHQRVHQAVVTACRPQPHHPVKTLLFFEIPSSTEWQPPGSAPTFHPNWFMDISHTLAIKQQALEFYQQEMRPFPHPRSPEAVTALAQWRGATVGVAAAEAFILGRHLG
ncbi:MAG: PIG-L deacetylase family protein [Cylindrospermopsis raciborskii]|uniref:PIG-L deacetylase family protein n=1 Tax=Cylindrospermopsis raciborskii TaxID=77022 RepID=UPI003D0E769C